MTIETLNSLFALSGLYGAGTTSTGATGNSSSSLFGPATQLSLGQSGSQSIGSTNNALGVYMPGSATGWQFNLSSVLDPGTSAIPQTPRTEEQVEAEEAAVQSAIDLINAGEFDDARELMNELLEENPTNAAAVHALGFADLTEGKYQEAEQLFLKAHALNPSVGYDNDATNARTLQQDDNAVLRHAQGMLKSTQHREEGMRLLVTLTERSPDHTMALVTLAEALLDEGDGDNGLMQYNAAIRAAESNGSELQLIEKNLSELVEAAPTGAFVRQLLGKVQLEQGRYEEALQTLTTAAGLAEDPVPYHRDVAEAYVGVGHERLKRGDLTGAMSAFDRAKEFSPTSYEVKQALAEGYVARARVHAQRMDYSSALDDYDRAATLLEGPANKSLRESVSQSAYALGRKLERKRIAAGDEIDAEVRAFQIAYDLDNDNKTYKRKLADTRNALGDQHMAAGEYEQAAAAYRRAHDLFVYDDTYKANAISAYTAWGDEAFATLDWDSAVEAFQKAYEIDTQNSEVKSKLAAAYNERGLDHKYWERNSAAASDFKNALRLFPDNDEYETNFNSVSAWWDPDV